MATPEASNAAIDAAVKDILEKAEQIKTVLAEAFKILDLGELPLPRTLASSPDHISFVWDDRNAANVRSYFIELMYNNDSIRINVSDNGMNATIDCFKDTPQYPVAISFVKELIRKHQPSS